jgi:hypothetical protein
VQKNKNTKKGHSQNQQMCIIVGAVKIKCSYETEEAPAWLILVPPWFSRLSLPCNVVSFVLWELGGREATGIHRFHSISSGGFRFFDHAQFFTHRSVRPLARGK